MQDLDNITQAQIKKIKERMESISDKQDKLIEQNKLLQYSVADLKLIIFGVLSAFPNVLVDIISQFSFSTKISLCGKHSILCDYSTLYLHNDVLCEITNHDVRINDVVLDHEHKYHPNIFHYNIELDCYWFNNYTMKLEYLFSIETKENKLHNKEYKPHNIDLERKNSSIAWCAADDNLFVIKNKIKSYDLYQFDLITQKKINSFKFNRLSESVYGLNVKNIQYCDNTMYLPDICYNNKYIKLVIYNIQTKECSEKKIYFMRPRINNRAILSKYSHVICQGYNEFTQYYIIPNSKNEEPQIYISYLLRFNNFYKYIIINSQDPTDFYILDIGYTQPNKCRILHKTKNGSIVIQLDRIVYELCKVVY